MLPGRRPYCLGVHFQGLRRADADSRSNSRVLGGNFQPFRRNSDHATRFTNLSRRWLTAVPAGLQVRRWYAWLRQGSELQHRLVGGEKDPGMRNLQPVEYCPELVRSEEHTSEL